MDTVCTAAVSYGSPAKENCGAAVVARSLVVIKAEASIGNNKNSNQRQEIFGTQYLLQRVSIDYPSA